MKKFVYLCGIILLSMNMMAQIDLNDKNWKEVLIKNFDDSLSYWEWNHNIFSNSDYSWKAYLGYLVSPDSLYQIYQFENAQYDYLNGTMKLVANYDTLHKIPDSIFYLPANGSPCPYLGNKLYFSGAIEYVGNIYYPDTGQFLYGYFEIHCKLPSHRGAFPAFWLHGASRDTLDPYYEEIDIFEYTWALGSPSASADWLPVPNPHPTYTGDPRLITTGIYHNLNGLGYDFETDTYARNYPRFPNGQDVNGWHTYSCEWMPDHVYWYLDGKMVNSYYDTDHIPRHPMVLKTNYAIDNYAVHRSGGQITPIWKDTAEMVIDHIRVYQLEFDCDADKTITCQSDLTSFDYTVKKSISITSSIEEVNIADSDKITFRIADSFEITGPFQADTGCEFTVLLQRCPE